MTTNAQTAGITLAGIHCTVTPDAWELALCAADNADDAEMSAHGEVEVADALWADTSCALAPSQFRSAAAQLIALTGRA